MALKLFKRAIFLITALVTLACSQDPDLKIARQFLDQYYVMANQDEALLLTEGQASELIQSEKELLKDVPAQQVADAYHSRDITFALEKEQKSDGEAIYLYRLKILTPGLGAQEKLINITIDRQSHKVRFFGNLQ